MSIAATEISETLGWEDYAVVGLMLVISASIGVYYRFTGDRQKTTEEYFLANRSMTVAPLTLGLTVANISTVVLLGMSSENYEYGSQIMALYLGSTIGTVVAPNFYLPVFFKLQCTSTYEYLERRFGVAARLIASIANSLELLLFTGVVLYAPALVIMATTGLSDDLSVLLLAIICTFYSTIGGIKGVLMTDVFQSLLIFVSVIMVIVFAAIIVDGGIPGIWQIAVDGGRIEFDNFSFDPTMRHTWWCLVFGGLCIAAYTNGIGQVQVQRLLTVKTLKEAKLAMWLSGLLGLFLLLMISFSGLAIYAYFSDCDPLAIGKITTSDMLMPYFVMKTMSHIPGLAGLFVAGIFSASLCNLSAMLNSLAAVFLEDYIKPTYAKLGYEFPEKRQTLIAKILAIAIGTIGLLVAFIVKYLGSLIETFLRIAGVISGPLLGLFTLGMFFESAEQTGAVFGTVASLAIVFWAAFGRPRPSLFPLPVSTSGCNVTLVSLARSSARQIAVGDSSDFYLYRISYMWYAPLGFAISIIVGFTVSNLIRFITKKTSSDLNPDLFTPLIAKRIRKKRFDVATLSKCQILGSVSQETITGIYPS